MDPVLFYGVQVTTLFPEESVLVAQALQVCVRFKVFDWVVGLLRHSNTDFPSVVQKPEPTALAAHASPSRFPDMSHLMSPP